MSQIIPYISKRTEQLIFGNCDLFFFRWSKTYILMNTLGTFSESTSYLSQKRNLFCCSPHFSSNSFSDSIYLTGDGNMTDSFIHSSYNLSDKFWYLFNTIEDSLKKSWLFLRIISHRFGRLLCLFLI